MTSPDNGPDNWLTVEEAAAAYRLSVRTVRRRLATGELEATKIKTPNGESWRIKPPGAPPDRVGSPLPPDSAPGRALIPLDALETLLAPLAQERDRLQAERDELRARVEELHAARLDDARTAAQEIGRLQGLLEAAQAKPVGEAQALDERSVTELLTALEAARPAARFRWPWQR